MDNTNDKTTAYSNNLYATKQGEEIWIKVSIGDTDVDITNVDPKSLQAYVSRSVAHYVYKLQSGAQAQREFESDQADLFQALHDLDGTAIYDAEGGNPSGVIVDQEWDVDTDDVVAENLEFTPDIVETHDNTSGTAIVSYTDSNGNLVEITSDEWDDIWDTSWDEKDNDMAYMDDEYLHELDRDTYSSDGYDRYEA